MKHNLIKNSNLDYKVILWDDQMISKLLYDYFINLYDLYNNLDLIPGKNNVFTAKSDIGRYVIMSIYGGFYIDMDFYSSINLDTLIDKNTDIIFADNRYELLKPLKILMYTPKYNLAFFAIKEKHEIWFPILNKLTNTRSREEIGQDNNIDFPLFPKNIVSTHTSCTINSNCFTPRTSSWFYLRPIICNIGCNISFILFILFIYLIILRYI